MKRVLSPEPDSRPKSPSLMTEEERALCWPVDAVDNAKGLPLWKVAIHGKKTDFKGVAGTLFWHPKHRFQVVGINNGDKVGFRRACILCNKTTLGLKEEHCGKCGGEKQVRKQCDVVDVVTGGQCTNTSRHNEDGVHKCVKHFVSTKPSERGCPQCQVQPRRQTRDDGLCGDLRQ